MKKALLALSLLALVLVAAASPKLTKLVRLTVVNKSGMPVEISLSGSQEKNIYYLRVPRGDREAPLEKTFTLVPDIYGAILYYVEPWDPVYGYECSLKSDTLYAMGNLTVTVMECNRAVKYPGENPSMVKFGFSRRR